MRLIADAGATKTDWALIISGSDTNYFTTDSITPDKADPATIKNLLNNIHSNSFPYDQIKHLNFYGTGCLQKERANKIQKVFQTVFKKSTIEIHSDLLGSARALYPNRKAIIGILGTGSSCCLYDGSSIQLNTPSLGYILGDEGSGSHLGKILLRAYLYKQLPQDIHDYIQNKIPYTISEIMEIIKNPQQVKNFLARFSKYMYPLRNGEYISSILSESFTLFIKNHVASIENYKDYPAGFTGSVAFHYADILKSSLKKFDINNIKIIQAPISELVKYHK